jgi:CheY-like chemotaxis protein
MQFKTCVSSEEAIQLCTDYKFKTVIIDMIIPDEDSLELAGRIKTLLPNARYLAMYLRNVADPMNEAFTAGFDGYIVKPFQKSQIEDLVLINSDAPESFDEILIIDENLLQAKPGRGKGEYEEYYSRMAELIGGAIEQLASDCFDDVTLDYTNLPASSLMTMLVSVSLQCCSELGLEARIVGGDDVKAAIEADEVGEGVQVFETLADAMASAG